MTIEQQIAEILNKIPEVRWDRYTAHDWGYIFYGWIDREQDSYKDFVVLYLDNKDGKIEPSSFITSSPKYSNEININLGWEPDDHTDCTRVESMFPNGEVDAIKL